MDRRARIRKLSRSIAIVAALLVLLWGTLIGLGRATGSALIPPLTIMIVSLAIYWLSGPKASGREP